MTKRLFVVGVIVGIVPAIQAAENPSAETLIGNCAANYDKVQSWMIKSTHSISSRNQGGERKYTDAYDVRSDGNNVVVRWREWGEVSRRAKPIPEENAPYRSMSWYGDKYINYGRGGNEKSLGSAAIDRNPASSEITRLRQGNASSYMIGFCCQGTFDRIDQVLRRAETVSVRPQQEAINGTDCYVLDAKTSNGNYTVWLDPEHGYGVAQVQARLTRADKHLFFGQPVDMDLTSMLRNVRFEEVEGIWVPLESYLTSRSVYGNADDSEGSTHIEVQEVALNPPPEVIGKLVPDDIRNGADVYAHPTVQIRYRWQDGRLVPKIDDEIVAEMDKTLGGVLANKAGETEPNETDSAAADQRSRELAQKRQRAHCGLYCLYSVLRLEGQELDYHDLVKPEYYGAHEGSSLAELRKGATDYGLHAEAVRRLSTRALRSCPYQVILHVKPHAHAKEYNHYELFMGTEKGMAKIFNPPQVPRLIPFGELAAQWDGAGLVLSAHPLNVDTVLTVDRQRLLLCGIIGVLILVAFHVSRFIWARLMGTLSRRGMIKLTFGQGVGIGMAALIFGMVYNLGDSEGLLANGKATTSVQKAYAGSFIPRISVGQMRKLRGRDIVLIDARLAGDYKSGHLDGAISLPIDANDALWKKTTASIPRGKPIVAYCQSAGCKFAENVSLRLMSDGFKDISVFRGGWNEWNGGAPMRAKGGLIWTSKGSPTSKS